MPPKIAPAFAGASTDELFQECQRRLEEQRLRHAAAEAELEQKLAEREARLKAREEELDARAKALEAKEEQLTSMLGGSEDVVEINAGGQAHAVSRGTLCSIDGSLLATMFSGRWEDKMRRDSAGRAFLDVDPQAFEAILAFLRLRRLAGPDDSVQLPEVGPGKQESLQMMVRYFGLDSLTGPVPTKAGPVPTNAGRVVTSLSALRARCSNIDDTYSDYFGYLVEFVRPFLLHAVFVGIVHANENARVQVGVLPNRILAERPVVPRACPDDPQNTHIAEGFDLVLQPPSCFIMVSGARVKVESRDNMVWTRGTLQVTSKYRRTGSSNVADSPYHVCMAVLGQDA